MINRTKLASSAQFLKVRVATSLHLVPSLAENTKMVLLFGKNCVGVATFWRLILSHSWILKRIMINRTKLASSWQFLKIRVATSLNLVPAFAKSTEAVLHFGTNYVSLAISVVSGAKFCPWLGKGGVVFLKLSNSLAKNQKARIIWWYLVVKLTEKHQARR